MQSNRRIRHPNNSRGRPRWLPFAGSSSSVIGAFFVLALMICLVPYYWFFSTLVVSPPSSSAVDDADRRLRRDGGRFDLHAKRIFRHGGSDHKGIGNVEDRAMRQLGRGGGAGGGRRVVDKRDSARKKAAQPSRTNGGDRVDGGGVLSSVRGGGRRKSGGVDRNVIEAINAGHQRASTGEAQKLPKQQPQTQSRKKYHRTTSYLHLDSNSESGRKRLAETRLGAMNENRRSSNDEDANGEDESGPDFGGLTMELPALNGVRSITDRRDPIPYRKPHLPATNDDEDKEELIASLFSHAKGENCVPFHPYQTSSYPNCNVVHETSFADPNEVALAGEGTQSIVFQIPDAAALTATSEERKRLIVKTQRYKKYIDSDKMEERRRDAVIQEHASSPYVASLYGFCGMGTLAALADDGRVLYDFVASVRRGGDEPDPLTKLKVAVQLAMGQSALHKIGVCHNDYDISQIVYVDGIMKLNDFNYAKMIPRDVTNGPDSTETCKGSSGMAGWKYRAPEDLRRIRGKGERFHMDKADVFSLGTALYMVLTNQWLWEGERREKSAVRLMNGERPEVPDRIANSTSNYTKAILKALDMCWTFDPDERPSSTEVAEYLLKELKRLDEDDSWTKEKGGDGIVRVAMPSENFVMGDDDDYDANM